MNVLVTEPDGFAPSVLDVLRDEGFEAQLLEKKLDPLSVQGEGIQGVFIRLGFRWTAELMDRFPHLQFIATPTTGLNHIDLSAASARGIEVLSLRGLPGLNRVTSTPEHALALLLALARNLCPAVASTRRGEWDRDAFVGRMLSEKTVGLVGLGRTGLQMARYADALSMQVLYYDPHVNSSSYTRCGSLEELASSSDVISVHAVLNPDTQGLLGADFFQACREHLLFVNTARGEIVDETALLNALTTHRVDGAALDVLNEEPVTGQALSSPLQHYAAQNDNLLITPHIAGATHESMRRTEELIAQAVVDRFGQAKT